ncbi:cop9 signalosome complex subunit 12 [Grosmannia clavigera kw1407]|uniref:Protein CSN12 homolog n=1 Tax=Grosmannia clavigera (strain kw1407 / UAMH 11150) TaxID=655863 RepID=F0XN54_GROCL|nr:cop9 signalosome complex subunit 12 [Grosmannia clavigera kw1407]EFX00984.1 cop9 signalosome complex subunit 12 [Grosmannia clavigera kw1407]
MDRLFRDFGKAVDVGDGRALATSLLPVSPSGDPTRLRNIWNGANQHDAKSSIKRKIQNSTDALNNTEVQGWTEVYYAYWKAVGEILLIQEKQEGTGAKGQATWMSVYEAWKDVTLALHRGYTNYGFEAWSIPTLYVVGKYLRVFAVKADDERNVTASFDGNATFQDDFDAENEKHQQLEDCARQLNRLFQLCLSDRTQDIANSRKWGIYGVINLLFKTYFKLNSAGLSRNILKALSAYQGDMPSLDNFPKSQRVTFKYYEGVLYFLEENYVEAEKHLTEAWLSCHNQALKNKDEKLLEPYPRLQKLFLPLSQCIKKGDLHAFDVALQRNEDEFVRQRIYLTLERGRDIALRNLLRKVFLAGGFEEPTAPGVAPVRRTRVPVANFSAAIKLGSQESLDVDEVECLIANMIYKNLMKGYIHRERGIVVLSKAAAFPGTGV